MIGIHIDSDLNNILSETKKVHKNKGQIIQLFINLSSSKASKYYDELKKYLKSKKMLSVVHISYTINCAQNWSYHSWWINQFITELQNATRLGSLYAVVHLGKQLDLSYNEGINNMYTALLYVHKQTSNDVKILIETSTGQGSEMCFELEKLAHFYNKFSKHSNQEIKNRFGICLDTCHIFAAGYDISTSNGLTDYFNLFDKLIGLEHIKLIHFNDSKKECGSKVDRHESIGNGFIGKESLLIIKNMFDRFNVPIILETPSENIFNDLKALI